MKSGILSKLTAALLSLCMVFAMAPLGLASFTAHASGSSAPGGAVSSNSAAQAHAAFGDGNVTASYSSHTLTITLQNDIDLQSPVLLKKGAAADTVLIDLNGHTLTGASGAAGTDKAAAQGKNTIEIQPADYNIKIQGSGSVIGGRGAVFENASNFKSGTDGGAAVCFVSNDDGNYWYPAENDNKLEYGLQITGGANITGGTGADLSGDDWVYNIQNESQPSSYLAEHFNLRAGAGGAGITQTNAGVDGGEAETPIFTRIEIIDGTIAGGAGGMLDFTTEGSPVMTHYGLMTNDAVDAYMQHLTRKIDTYDDYVANMMQLFPGNGGDGTILGVGRKYVRIEQGGTVKGGPCGVTDYGKSRLVNDIRNIDNRVANCGDGISVCGDVGLKNVDPDFTDSNWSSKTKDSDDMGIYIAGAVMGGSAPEASARNENAGDAGSGIVMHGDFQHSMPAGVTRPYLEEYKFWGIVEVDSGATVSGGNGGNAIHGKGGHSGYGIYEDYTKSNDGSAGSYQTGTDSYLINGTVSGGNGGSSMRDLSTGGFSGINFGNYRKGVKIFGSGTAVGGNGGKYVVRGAVDSDTAVDGIHIYPNNDDHNNVIAITSEDGQPSEALHPDNSGLSVTAAMTPFSQYPSTSTKLSCAVNKPAGYNGAVYVKWTVDLKLQTNSEESYDIEPSGTNSSSFDLRSNEQYKYLAYKSSQSDYFSKYNIGVATTDRIKETIQFNGSWAEIYCTVQLADGRWAKSNVMHFTNEGWNGGSNGGQTVEEQLKAEARNVADMIDALYTNDAGELKLHDANAVAAARQAYADLVEAGNPYVETYMTQLLMEKLVNAETRIADLVAADDVTQQIADIVALLKDTKAEEGKTAEKIADARSTAQEAIEDARGAFEALNAARKELVPNQETLSAAETLIAVPETDYQTALAAFIENYDLIVLTEANVTAPDVTYNRSKQAPVKVTVKNEAQEDVQLTEDMDYRVSYQNNINAGQASYTVTGKGKYTGEVEGQFTIKAKAIVPTVKLSTTSYVYKGVVRTPAVTVKDGSVLLTKNTDYTVTYPAGRKNAGTYKVTVKMIGNYSGTKTASFTITKAANTLKVKGKTATVKYAKLKKKTQRLGVTKVITFTSKGQGAKTYVKKSGNKKITINKKTGKVTIRKKLKKGTYKVKVNVRAAGSTNYKPVTRTVTFKIRVK